MLQSSSQISNLPGEIHSPLNSRVEYQLRSHISITEATCPELYCNWTFCILGPLFHIQQLRWLTQREGLHPSLLLRDWLVHVPHQQPSAAPVLFQIFLSVLFSFPGSSLTCEEKCVLSVKQMCFHKTG